MARRDSSPDFVEAIARGLDVIRAFGPRQPVMSLAAVAAAASLPRPTARRILLTLEELGYVRAAGGGFELTPRVLDLGMSYVLSRGLWEIARPHMEQLVARTRESSSVPPARPPRRSSKLVTAVCPLSGRVDDPRPAGGGPQPPAPADRPRYPLPCAHTRQG